MARIGIITCSNCKQETNCASVVCLGDMRKRRGFFDRYPIDQPLDLFKELLCQTLSPPQTMTDMIRGNLKIPQD